MFAVFDSGGKQHRVTEGEVVRIERLEGDLGDNIEFERVLIVAEGDNVSIGSPYLDGGKVTGEVIGQGRDEKVRIVKCKRRKNYLRRAGHRQYFTEVKITGITG